MDAKAVYSKFSAFLDSNYSAADAISEVQNKCPQLRDKVGQYGYATANAKPISEYTENIVKSVKTMLKSYEAVVVVAGKQEGLEEKIDALAETVLGHARLHDSLLKIDPASASYCLPDIEALLLSTSGELCRLEDEGSFKVNNIGSLQDAMRYMHGNAVETVFGEMQSFRERPTNESDAPLYEIVGAGVRSAFVFDLGGGVSGSAAGRKTISREDITSEPLKAIGEFYPKAGMSVFASHDFMNAQADIGGYHHATVEATIRKSEFGEGVKNYADNNHIRVRYIECARDMGGRLDYISAVMRHQGFEVARSPGVLDAKIKGCYPDTTEKKLKEVFRLFASCGIGMDWKMDLAADEVAKTKGVPVDEAAKDVVKAAVKEFEGGNTDISGFLDTLSKPKKA